MLENDIPLTKENLNYAQALRQTELTTSAENVAALAAEAVSEGKSAQDAVILSGYTWMEQAQNAVDTVENATDEDLVYIVEKGLPLTLDSLREAAANRVSESTVQDADGNYTQKGQQLLTARRQLEEIRLAMTAEANYRLLKQGISIDTEPLVKLVEQLKDQENEYYRNLLMSEGVDATKEQVELFGEVDKKVTDMRYVPAYVLGMKDADVSTINGVHEAGTELKTSFEKASRQYETLMTAPRADLGDSIQKAFRNVDDILNDLGMELTDENRRAVRILTMKAADEEVQRVFKNMTPAVVTQMIKRGINPLEMDFTSLNQVCVATSGTASLPACSSASAVISAPAASRASRFCTISSRSCLFAFPARILPPGISRKRCCPWALPTPRGRFSPSSSA